jgi:excisionase family DNA binding protein
MQNERDARNPKFFTNAEIAELLRLPAVMTPAEAAGQLRISRSKCYELIKAGALPHILIGGSIRIPTAAIAKLSSQALER